MKTVQIEPYSIQNSPQQSANIWLRNKNTEAIRCLGIFKKVTFPRIKEYILVYKRQEMFHLMFHSFT